GASSSGCSGSSSCSSRRSARRCGARLSPARTLVPFAPERFGASFFGSEGFAVWPRSACGLVLAGAVVALAGAAVALAGASATLCSLVSCTSALQPGHWTCRPPKGSGNVKRCLHDGQTTSKAMMRYSGGEEGAVG